MKKILYFFVICAVIGFIASSIISTLPAFEMLGRGFLMNVKDGNYDLAYAVFSEERQKQLPLDAFKDFIKKNELDTYKDVKWVKSVISDDKLSGYVIGEVSIAGNPRFPIEIDFVKIKTDTFSGETWFVDNIYVGKEVILRRDRPE